MGRSLDARLKDMAEKQRKAKEGGEGRSIDKAVLISDTTEESAAVIARFSPTLPSVADDKRAMANAILRSSLFGVVEKGHRKHEKKVLKATVNGLTLKVTGEQLDQSDFDVFLECLNRNKGLSLGSVIRFTSGSFLKSIGRDVGKANYVWLNDVLSRLAVYGMELGDGVRFYEGTLLHEKYRDEKTREHLIVINPKIAVFFVDGHWTGLSIEERVSMKGKQLALWLHGFYSTHDSPFAYKVETLQEKCGSETGLLKKFRQMLNKALLDLAAVTGWTCWIDEKTDLVYVVKAKAVRHE